MAVYALINSNNIVDDVIVADADFIADLPSWWLETWPTMVQVGDCAAVTCQCGPGWTWTGGTSFTPPPEPLPEQDPVPDP